MVERVSVRRERGGAGCTPILVEWHVGLVCTTLHLVFSYFCRSLNILPVHITKFLFRTISEEVKEKLSGPGDFPSTLHLSSATLKTLLGGDQKASEDAVKNQISRVVNEWLLKQHERICVEKGDIVLSQRFPDQVWDSAPWVGTERHPCHRHKKINSKNIQVHLYSRI